MTELADLHRLEASRMFGVPPEQVTDEQRRYAKVTTYPRLYSLHRKPQMIYYTDKPSEAVDPAQLHRRALQVVSKIEAWLLADTDEDTGPGTWLCELSDDKAWLSYRWPVDAEGYNGDEPWTEWGGNAFLERNGLRVVNAWMIDGCDTAWIDLK